MSRTSTYDKDDEVDKDDAVFGEYKEISAVRLGYLVHSVAKVKLVNSIDRDRDLYEKGQQSQPG